MRKVFSRIRRKIHTRLNLPYKHQYGEFFILLPADHLLPIYQRKHKLYDRFLPHIAKYLDPGSTIIDVGANCGDTLAAMHQANKSLVYVCIEPDDFFFKFLQANARRIRGNSKGSSIKTIQSLIGKSVKNASLEGTGGTKKAIKGSSGATLLSSTLDAILSANSIHSVKLLKSDVDGYDYDVIDSAEEIIARDVPILFFECQFDHSFQKAGYEATIYRLALQGYDAWVIFDNFGEIILRTDSTAQIFQLFNYVWHQNVGRSTRTIHYFDVLAFAPKDHELVGRVVADYVSTC